jgi:hypothetical protein
MFDKLVEKLLGKQQAKRQTVAQRYRAAIVAAADGKGDEKEIESALTAAGKTVEQFRDDVQLYVKRRAAAETVAKAKAAPAEREKLAQVIRDAEIVHQAAVAAADAKANEIIVPARWRMAQLDQIEAEARTAERFLHQTASDKQSESSVEVAELRQQIAGMRQREIVACDFANRTANVLNNHKTKMQQIGGGPMWGELQREFRELTQSYEDAAAKHQKLIDERQAIERQLESIAAETQHAALTP